MTSGSGALGYNNYFASTGGTAAVEIGSAAHQENVSNRLGVYNANILSGGTRYLASPPAAANTPNPNYLLVTGTKLAEITDGTSNTAGFSETLRSRAVANTVAEIPTTDLINVYLISSVFTSAERVAIPTSCSTFSGSRIRYRGQQYYRNLPMTGYYSHTLVPKLPEMGLR